MSRSTLRSYSAASVCNSGTPPKTAKTPPTAAHTALRRGTFHTTAQPRTNHPNALIALDTKPGSLIANMTLHTDPPLTRVLSPHSIALVSEPYIGARKEVKLPYGYPLNIIQFPSNSSPVRACIIAKPHIKLFGITEFSSSDLCVVRTQIGHTQLHIASIYIPPRHDHLDTLSLIENFLQHNMNTQCILGGDLNGWNPLWGSNRRNARGVRIEELADAYGLYALVFDF
ncbi:unnamed protein product, partial [Brenthis ino]